MDYLTKEHGNKVLPRIEALGIAFSFVFDDQAVRIIAIENTDQLTK
ncbi:MAG: hypothetical protein SV686_05130 [Thermodesulfobacteriota bacterium]|nr:hypothetical protein [Thermodesulfobacteriota bacterium]